MRRIFIAILTIAALLPVRISAENKEKVWSIETNLCSGTISQDDDYWEVNNNESNIFILGIDYYLNRHVALNGGLYAEQRGLFTDFDENIGLLKHWSAGVYAGAKWYPLHEKFILQPYASANLYLNALNLTKQTGEKNVSPSNGIDGQGTLDYEIQHPFISAGPKLGLDIRVISSLSLTFAYELRYDFYGKADGELTMTSGNWTGKTFRMRDEHLNRVFSIGLKLDFPTRDISEKGRNNLIQALFYLLSK